MKKREEMLRRFGRQVTELREKKQYTIKELARAAGLSYRHLLLIEAGQVNLLYTTLISLAAALELPPEELLRTCGG